ncbi:type II toxin-antitoxin system VapC family toxin [Jannaschia sp. LMIT008]|uniref:type II toxin-antitoxin system VapC family toxin n=1 Tax=Jannaschia maritima TaxID=3032585 RepID=UPI002810A7F8|nr:type II toxin-antitoxin system VapC family toxin [Jannaschia sp. LMIT008]
MILLDTHVWAWTIHDTDELSETAIELIGSAEVFVSPVSFYEIGNKVRIGKWPEMTPYAERLPRILREQGMRESVLDANVMQWAACHGWRNRDPFDRMLAATARSAGYRFVTKDAVFRELPGLDVIW